MRIKIIVPVPVDADGLERRRRQIPTDLASPGTEVVFVPVRNSGAWKDSAHDVLLADFFVYEAGMTAEEEGFDAVCIDTVSDSALEALRSRLSIPVLGPGQTVFHMAAMLGRRFSILTMWSNWVHIYERKLREYGLAHLCASIRYPGIQPDTRKLLQGKEDKVLPALHACAVQCVEEDGADVLILGSTTMHEAHAYLADRMAVPVINPGPLNFKLAEALVQLGLTHSKSAFPSPAVLKDDVFRAAGEASDELESRRRDQATAWRRGNQP